MALPLPPRPANPPKYVRPEQIVEQVAPPGTSPLARLLGNLDDRALKVIDFPGGYLERDPITGTTRIPRVGLWALTDEESRNAMVLALSHYQNAAIPVEQADKAGLIQQELRVQTLAQCMRHPDQPAFAFGSANDVRRMTSDLQDALHLEYVQWLDERSPLRKLDPAQLDAHIDALVEALGKDEPVDALLSYYDTGTLRHLVGRLAHRLMYATRPLSSDSSVASDGATSLSDPSADGAQASPTASPPPSENPARSPEEGEASEAGEIDLGQLGR